MLRTRYSLARVFIATLVLSSGCLALSFGGKSQQVDNIVSESPETINRISNLEARVGALEQQQGLPINPTSGVGGKTTLMTH
jgi:hypothetical protein